MGSLIGAGGDPYALLLLAPLVLAAVAYDAVKSPPKERVAEIEAKIEEALDKLRIQEVMAEHAVKAGQKLTDYYFLKNEELGPASPGEQPDYRSLRVKGIDSILEISVLKMGFESDQDTKEDLTFFMVANFNFSDKHGQVCGLPPIYPERNLSFWRAHAGWEFVEIDSLKPTLKWEAFSKGKDKEGRLNRISEASYDLKVWHVEDKIPVELIYFRQGLVSSSHKLEQSLEPGNKYCWTIRARFKVNGQPRATSWARSGLCDLWGLAIPVIHDQYFRFKTPPESEIPK